MIHEFYAVDNQ